MSQKSLKILLIQDRVESRREIHDLLLKTDFVQFTLECVPAKLAWSGFSRNYYDVCIIDAGGQGVSLLQESRRVNFATPMIVLTSDSAVEVLSAIHHGAADCLIRVNVSPAALEESICSVIDSASYKEHESQCARSYLALVENSSEIIYTQDLQGRPTFVNRTFEQVIGYTREEVLKMNFDQILAPECVEFVWCTIESMLGHRRKSNYQAFLLTKEGHRVPLSVTMHLIYKDGNPIGVQCVARDVSWRFPATLAIAESERREEFKIGFAP